MHILKSKRETYQIRIELLIRGGNGALIRKVIRIGKGGTSQKAIWTCVKEKRVLIKKGKWESTPKEKGTFQRKIGVYPSTVS